MKITSERFLLRDFEEADREPFLRFHYDPRLLARYGPDEAAPRHGENLFEQFRAWAAEEPRRKYQLATFGRDRPEELIGCCGLRGDGNNQRSAMGIGLAPECWGRYGYAVEIACVLLVFGFTFLKLEQVYGRTASTNDQVERLARWFGAVQTGSVPASKPTHLDQAKWLLTRESWTANAASTSRWAASVHVRF